MVTQKLHLDRLSQDHERWLESKTCLVLLYTTDFQDAESSLGNLSAVAREAERFVQNDICFDMHCTLILSYAEIISLVLSLSI